MQPDGHGVVSDRLDRMLELDPPPVDLVPLGREGIGNILGGNRAEQLALLAGLALERQRGRAENSGEALGLHALGLVAGAARASLGRDPLLVALGGLEGEALGQEIIPRVARLDPDQLAGLAE